MTNGVIALGFFIMVIGAVIRQRAIERAISEVFETHLNTIKTLTETAATDRERADAMERRIAVLENVELKAIRNLAESLCNVCPTDSLAVNALTGKVTYTKNGVTRDI